MTNKAVPEGKYQDVGGGLRIHYHEAGTGDLVVFVHGSGPGASGWSNFRGNYPTFAEHGFRALVPDTIGFGYSSKPEDVDYDFELVLGGLKRFLKALGITRCALVGNSHGGALCIQLALDEPALVSHLVLMAPGGLEERERYMEMKGIRSMMKAVLAPEGVTRESLRKVFALQLFDGTKITDEVIEERYQIAETQPKRVLSTLKVPYLAPRLGEIECPVLAFWGNEDQFCPVSGATTLAERCRDSRVMRISRCGHWVMVERPKMFNQISTEFLRPMKDEDVDRYGDELYRALRERTTVPPLTSRESDLTIEDAYRISRRILDRRIASGEKVIGKKTGVTNKIVQRALGVHQPDFGYLTDRMRYENGADVPIERVLIQPRCEAEIAFVLSRDLRGPGVTNEDVLQATAYVAPCFEIVDSRISEWKIKIQDTIADNASSGVFLLGEDRALPETVDFEACGVVVWKNGELLSTGAGAAALGSPVTCVAWLANTLGAFGTPLREGEVILSGSLVPLEPVVPGDEMRVRIGGIGSARVRFV